jgi:hypothetical protein
MAKRRCRNPKIIGANQFSGSSELAKKAAIDKRDGAVHRQKREMALHLN